ncbi:MAG: AAA family ATPase [Pseudomonadota bacterium]
MSYSRVDQEIARRFADALEAEGFELWWDTRLNTGDAYDEVTEQALKDARAVIVLWSKRSVESRWVRAEATLADRQKTLVPAMIEDCVRPVMFELTQTADLIGWGGDRSDQRWQAFAGDVTRFVRGEGRTEDAAPAQKRSADAVRQGRRQATVLYCGVEPATKAAEAVDPEDWSDQVAAVQNRCKDLLSAYGVDARALDTDAVLAVFGEDRSREDHAERAVRAALDIVGDAQIKAEGGPCDVRIGIETGVIIASDQREAASGPSISQAERLQRGAASGDVILGAAAARLAGPYFDLEAQPGGAFRVAGSGPAQTRFDVSRARGLSHFVGRGGDFKLLEEALERSQSGDGQVIGLVAEAGIGKSRLCYEFIESCRARGVPVFEGRAVAHGKHIPLLPILGLFRSFFGIEPDDSDAEAREKIEARLLALDESFASAFPLLFDFLGVSDPDRPSPRLDPSVRQRQLIQVMRQAIILGAKRGASVTLIEDLHWMDPASEQFVEQMVEARGGAGSLLLLNFRPEYSADWMRHSWYRQVPLAPLAGDAVGELLADLLGDDPSVADLAEPIRARTSGNPFFTEELVRNLIENGQLEGEPGAYRLTAEIDKISVPSTVHAVLAARIDRLPERERRTLQLAATIGKDFPETLVMAASDLPEDEVRASLAALRSGEFVFEKSFFPEVEFSFKHPLTQEVALDSLLKDQRRQLHKSVAQALEAGSTGQEDAALLAQHWEAAGEPLAAARYHRNAAEWVGLTDLGAASWHWTRVRTVLKDAGGGQEAAALGVAACQHLLNLGWRFGIDRAEVDALYQDGLAFAQSVGDRHAELNVAMVCSRALASVGDVAGFVTLARENYETARGFDDTAAQVNASLYLVDALTWTAELPEALGLAEQALQQVSKEVPPSEWIMGFNPHTVLKFWRATCLVMMGRLQEGLSEYEQCQPLLEADGTPEGVAYLWSWSALAYFSAGDIERVVACAEEVDRVCTEIGDPPTVVAHRKLCQTYLHLAHGQAAKAVETASEALAIHRAYEQQHAGMTAGFVAEALLHAGRASEAVEMAEEAIGLCKQSHRRNLEAQAHGALARALLARDGPDAAPAAEEALARAADLIEKTGAGALEPGLHEWRAALCETLDDTAGRDAALQAATASYQAIGAPFQAARLAATLAA